MRIANTSLSFVSLVAGLILSGRAEAQCPGADAYEDSDDCANAVALTVGSYTNLTLEGVAAPTGEDGDFFSVLVAAGEILQVDCTHIAALGDTDVYLYDAAGGTCGSHVAPDYLARGYTGTDNENVVWANATGAAVTVIVEVDAWDHDTAFTCNDYSLNISTFGDPCSLSVDDSFEPNDNCASATPLAVGSQIGLFASEMDADYYTVFVPAAEILTVDVAYSTLSADVDLILHDDFACTNQVAASVSAAGAGTVLWRNTTGVAATIVLEARVPVGSGCNNYDLNVSTAPDPCQDPLADDALEGNDSCVAAIAMNDGLTTDLFVSKSDADFYQVMIADGATLDVNVYAVADSGDLDVYLYDDLGGCGDTTSGYLVRGYTSSDDESITWTNMTGSTATYIVQVNVWSNSAVECNRYDIEILGSAGVLATPFCFGDGTTDVGNGPVSCPCANNSVAGAGEGCLNSQGVGAILTASGTNAVASDNMVFRTTQARASQPSVLMQGAAVVAFPFKDGILCMGNPTERLEVVFLDANGEGSTSGSVVTGGAVSLGDTRYYQQWYRDPNLSVCGNGSSLTQGLAVTWQ